MAKKPATKSYPVFDCDAHINDYHMQWEKHYSESERDLLKDYYWNYDDYHLINGRTIRISRPKDKWWIFPGRSNNNGGPMPAFTDFSGPGMTKQLWRKVSEMDLTVEQLRDVGHLGSLEPLPRVKDMDMMGIDQVLVIPIILTWTLQWIENARAAAIVARAYNDWSKQDYCDAAPDRLFPCGMLAPQDPSTAAAELRRIAKLGFPVASIRPIDALGKYPNQRIFDSLWRAFEETGVVCGMHQNMAGQQQQGQFSPTQILDRVSVERQIQGAGQTFGFIYEAMTWITGILLSGFLERYPGVKMCIFESNATWLPMVLEGCDRLYHLYGSQRLPKVKELPSETFRRRCLIAFESDEDWVFRRHRYFADIAIWSSDAYHGDGADAWEAVRRMEKAKVPVESQAKMMGGNARRFYGLEDRVKLFTTEEPARYPRPDWFPNEEDVEREFATAGEPRAGRA